MKRFLVLLAALTSTSGFALNHNPSCRITYANESLNFMEEGLGIYADPEVDGDSKDVYFHEQQGKLKFISIGQMSFDNQSGDKVTVRRASTGKLGSYSITDHDGELHFKIEVYKSERGVVLLQSEETRGFEKFVAFDCSDVKPVKAAYPGQRNVRAMSKSQVAKLPQAIHENMNFVDVPFEKGDGYYDIKEIRTFAVYWSGKRVGFIEWYHLNYTEGDDEYVYVRYDRNGARLSEYGDFESAGETP